MASLKEMIREIRPDLSRGEIDEFAQSHPDVGSIQQAIIGWHPNGNEKWHTVGMQNKKAKGDDNAAETNVERTAWQEYRPRTRGGGRGRGRGGKGMGRGNRRPGPSRPGQAQRQRRGEIQKGPQTTVTISSSQGGAAWGAKKPPMRTESGTNHSPPMDRPKERAKENIAPGMAPPALLTSSGEEVHFSKQSLPQANPESPQQINGSGQPAHLIVDPPAVQPPRESPSAGPIPTQTQPPPGVPSVASASPEKKPQQQTRNTLGSFKINSDNPPDGMGDFAQSEFGVSKLAPPPGITTRPTVPKRETKKQTSSRSVEIKPSGQKPGPRMEPSPQAAKFAITFPTHFTVSKQGIEELTKSFRAGSLSVSPPIHPREPHPSEPSQVNLVRNGHLSSETIAQPTLTLTRPETTTFPARQRMQQQQAPLPGHLVDQEPTRTSLHRHNPEPARVHNPEPIRVHNPEPIRVHNPEPIAQEPPSFQATNSSGPSDRNASNFGISPQYNGGSHAFEASRMPDLASGYPNVNNYVPPQSSRLDPNAVPYSNPEPTYPVPFYATYRGAEPHGMDGRMLRDNFFDPTMGPTAPGGGAGPGLIPPLPPHAHNPPEMSTSAYGQNTMIHPQSHMFPFVNRNPHHQYMRPYR